jgi:hypothetical protein
LPEWRLTGLPRPEVQPAGSGARVAALNFDIALRGAFCYENRSFTASSIRKVNL